MPPLSEQEMNAHLAEESRVSQTFKQLLFVYLSGSSKACYDT